MHFEPSFSEWLIKLSNNNNREWFHENKKDFDAKVRTPFKAFVANLIKKSLEEGILTEDVDPKKTIFRINRDTRFSKDKTPYKTHVAALISDAGTKNKLLPGFYLHIDAGRVMLGGGAYFMEKNMLYNVRQKLANQETDLPQAIENKNFKNTFGSLQGEKNKRLPKEFMAKAEEEPLLFYKHFFYMTEYPIEKIMQEDAIPFVMEHFRIAHPVNESLKAAVQ